MMMLPLRKVIEQQAPNINLHMIPYTIINTEQVLDDATVDLVIGTNANAQGGNIRAEHMFHPHYICAMRPGHPLAKADMSLEEFANAQHLLVSLSGDIVGVTDEVLAQQGLTRRIAMSVNQFSMVTPLLANSDLICVAPLGAIAQGLISGEITGTLPPLQLSPPSANIFWHIRQDKDQGLVWLRDQVRRIVKEAEARNINDSMAKLCGNNKVLCEKLSLPR
jgi:DNA-binding transcriptional LysR family regulator